MATAMDDQLSKMRMTMNATKLELFGNAHTQMIDDNDHPSIQLQGTTIRVSPSRQPFRLLGMWTDMTGDSIIQQEKQCQKAAKLMHRLSWISLSVRQLASVINATLFQKLAWAAEVTRWSPTQMDNWAMRTIKRRIHYSIRLPRDFIYTPTAQGGLGLKSLESIIAQRSFEFLHKVLNLKRNEAACKIARGCLAEIGELMNTKQAPQRIAQQITKLPSSTSSWPIVQMILRGAKLGYQVVHKNSPSLLLTDEIVDSGIYSRAANILTKLGLTQLDQIVDMDTITPREELLTSIEGFGNSCMLSLKSYLSRWTPERKTHWHTARSCIGNYSPSQIAEAKRTFDATPLAGHATTPTIEVFTDGGFDPETQKGSYGIIFPGMDITECGRVPFADCSYRTEWYAIARAVQLTHPDFRGRIEIKTDSQSAIQAWESWTKSSPEQKRKTRDRDLMWFVEKLLKQRGSSIGFSHVYGHSGVADNEAADRLATLGLAKDDWMTPFLWLDTTTWPDTYTALYNGHPVTIPVTDHIIRTLAAKTLVRMAAKPRCQIYTALAEREEHNAFLMDPFLPDNLQRIIYLAKCGVLPTQEYKAKVLNCRDASTRCRVCVHHLDDTKHALISCSLARVRLARVDIDMTKCIKKVALKWGSTCPNSIIHSPITGVVITHEGPNATRPYQRPPPSEDALKALLGGLPKSFTKNVTELICATGADPKKRLAKAHNLLRRIQKLFASSAHSIWREHCHATHILTNNDLPSRSSQICTTTSASTRS